MVKEAPLRRSLVGRPQCFWGDGLAIEKYCFYGVIGRDARQRILGEQQQVRPFARLNRAQFTRKSEGDGVVESGGTEYQRQRCAGIGPLLQFETPVQARRVS